MDAQSIVSCLEGAGSAEAAVRTSSEAQLRKFEDEPGFHALLQGLYLDRGVPEQVRWQAAIYFKNSINSHWRKTSTKPIGDEEKQEIRSRLFNVADEKNKRIGDQNAAAAARIARMDFPRDWPSLMEDIYKVVEHAERSGDVVSRFNCCKILYHVVKTLSMAKLGQTRPRMQAQVGPFMTLLTGSYESLVNSWLQSGDNEAMELSVMELKCLSRLLVEGYEHCNRDDAARRFFSISANHFTQFLALYSSSWPSDVLAKHVKVLGKMYISLIDRQSSAFVLMDQATLSVLETTISLLEDKTKLFHDNNSQMDEENFTFWEGTLVRGLMLIDNLIKLKHGSISMRHRTEEDREEAKRAVDILNNVVFSEELLVRIVETLLLYCMRLQTRDLEMWHSDPEEFFILELRDSWEFQLRSSGAKVFGDLLANFGEQMVPKIISYLNMALDSNNQEIDILQKDCALQAFQMSSFALSEQVDFDQVFPNGIVPLAHLQGDRNLRIIRRRICYVLSEWVSVKCSPENRVLGYKTLLGFLEESDELNDLVVQLEAMQAIRYMVDEYMFDPNGFLPYVHQVVGHLFRLLRTVSTVEVKHELLKILSILIEQCGESLAPYADVIQQMIPQAWEEETLQGVVLQILANIVTITQNACPTISAPILQVTLEPNNLLFEDALPLWKSVVQVSDEPNEQVFNLVERLIEGIESSTEMLTELLEILAEYFKLSYHMVLDTYGNRLFSLFASYIPNLRAEAISVLCQSIDWLQLLSKAAEYGPIFQQTGFLSALISQTFEQDTSAFTAVKVYNIVGRLAFDDPNLTWTYIEPNAEQVWNKWLERYDNIGAPKEQKLQALGITRMLYTKQQIILNSVPQIMSIWETVMDSEDSLNPDEEIEFSTDNKKDKQILQTDPVFTISLKDEVMNIQSQLHLPNI
ncbi:hypothetical protein TRICI_001539 [Trichomonascus ciferrii]|uniref:Importin N-terminal domain-containing protein n=1 Tax=Trichomonascus ciferrii TaxID=44093 RepID=A0A642V9L7_9ASCO|nr:hypothetical protein TRICI_001539 [Trichomonascus ciferrii]